TAARRSEQSFALRLMSSRSRRGFDCVARPARRHATVGLRSNLRPFTLIRPPRYCWAFRPASLCFGDSGGGAWSVAARSFCCKQPSELGHESVPLNGLTDEVIATEADAFVAIAGRGKRGDRENGLLEAAVAELTDGFIAVQHRHLHVHDHRIEGVT